MNQHLTVRAYLMEDMPAVQMVWEQHVISQHVRQAFRQINTLLDNASCEMYVIVDISADPIFPIVSTLEGAMEGPYRNPNLKEWLIIGINPLAKMIEKILSSTTGRHNVRWFDNEDEVIAYVLETHSNPTEV